MNSHREQTTRNVCPCLRIHAKHAATLPRPGKQRPVDPLEVRQGHIGRFIAEAVAVIHLRLHCPPAISDNQIGTENNADVLYLKTLNAVDGPGLTDASRIDSPVLGLRDSRRRALVVLRFPREVEVSNLDIIDQAVR
jgi:hypothetical protein